MSGVFKTSSQADNNQNQQNKLQEIQSRIRIQQSQQQKNSLIPSQFFYSSAPSSSDESCIQKQRIEFHHHVKNFQNFGKASEEKDSSNKNWAAKTSLLNRLRLKTAATCEGRKNNIGGNKEQLERNGTKKQSEIKINTNNCIAVADEALTRAASFPISNTTVAFSTENQPNFDCSLSTLNSTSNSGALDKQHFPLPPSISDHSDDFIKQNLAPETSASISEKSTTFCDNKTPSDSLTNPLTDPSQIIKSTALQTYSFSNTCFVESSKVATLNTLVNKTDENKLERQSLLLQPSVLDAVQQQKSPPAEPFAVPELPTSKQKTVSIINNSREEPKLLKKEQEELQIGQAQIKVNQIQDITCLNTATNLTSFSVNTEKPNTLPSVNQQVQQLTTYQGDSFELEETQQTNISKAENLQDFLDNKKEEEKESHCQNLIEAIEPLDVEKSKRLSLRISSTAALQFRRLALHHSKVLSIIGINSIQFNLRNTGIQTSLDCLSPIVQLIEKRAPSLNHISRRRSRLHHLRQQKQLLLQHTQKQQQSAAIALQQRNSQRHQISTLPQKSAATPIVAATSMSSVARTSKNRLVPVPAETSPHLNSHSYGQRQHNSSSSSNSTTPQQRTPPSHPPPIFSSPSLTAIFQQQNEHQQSMPNINSNKKNDSPHLMLSSSVQKPQQSSIATSNQSEANTCVAENSPFLVNLLSNKPTSSPVLQQSQNSQQILQQNVTPSLQQQQQIMLVKQQQVAALQQQQHQCLDPGSSGCLPPYQQTHHLNSQHYGGPMNLQQQQQMYQQQHQRLTQQSMIYGVGPSVVLNNPPQQQHYMIIGSPPTGSSSSQYHRQSMQCSANGQPTPGGIIASPPGAPSPYFGTPPIYTPQNIIAPNAGCSAISTQVTVDESPKKRKRISKKQQKEQQLKEEREQHQMRLQEQQHTTAMAAFRHHQQMIYMQQQRMAGGGVPQQMCGMPLNMQACQIPPGQVVASHQHYQQQQMYQQHYIGLNGQPTTQKPQDTNVIQNNLSSSICSHGAPQKNSPIQISGTSIPQQQYVVSIQPGQQPQQNNYYIMSPQQQAAWTNATNQVPPCGMQQQNALTEFPATTTNQSQQQHQQMIQSQQAFRTPSTPHYFSQSPASATPFYSPPPSHNQQQQSVGPISTICSGPTPPHSVGSFGNSQQMHSDTPNGSSLDMNVETTKKHNTLDQTQNHQLMTNLQHPSNEFYHQQQRFHYQRQQTMVGQQQSTNHQTSQNSLYQQQPSQNFPQLSDFAESGLGDANDLSVPTILNEGIDDLDSIEPMRYGSEQQQQNHNLDQRQQQQIVLQQQNDFYRENQQQLLGQQGQGQPKQNVQGVKRQLLNSGQPVQQCKKQKRKYSNHQIQNGMDDEKKNILTKNDKSHQDILKMAIEQRKMSEIVLLPDRSPQLGDTPLSPSKLSETQDRNVSDSIASVMERVAKHGQPFVSKTSNF